MDVVAIRYSENRGVLTRGFGSDPKKCGTAERAITERSHHLLRPLSRCHPHVQSAEHPADALSPALFIGPTNGAHARAKLQHEAATIFYGLLTELLPFVPCRSTALMAGEAEYAQEGADGARSRIRSLPVSAT